jgi:hypothetical protein
MSGAAFPGARSSDADLGLVTSVRIPHPIDQTGSAPPSMHNGAVKIARQIVVFDAADIAAESEFWAGLLGGKVVADGNWHSVVVDGEWRLGVQHAPDHVRPEWPNGNPQQIHLDLWVDDLAAAHEHAVSLGARLLQPVADPSADEQFQVYADPAGHPFCLCWAAAMHT